MKQRVDKKKAKLKLLPSSAKLEGKVRENACFTIIPTDSGFTDQMMQFSAFYKLGRTLGLKYLHIPFKASRSESMHSNWRWKVIKKKPVDIYDYLGFNQYMLGQSEGKAWGDAKRININIGNFSRHEEITFAEVVHYVQETIYKHYGQRDGQRILFCFRLNTCRAFFSVIHKRQQDLPDSLNLRKAFLQRNKKERQASVYKKTGIRILLHIRQGDTAVLKTPWKTYIPVDGRRPGYLQEHQELSMIATGNNNKDIGPIFSIAEYHSFFSGFMEKMSLASDSVKLFSDGFRRAFGIIFSHPDRHNLSNEQVKTLESIVGSYDQNQFSKFKGIQYFIGERDDYLQHMIRAALEADIVILGFQQRMLPKFLANYRLDNMPLVIVLHKGDLPDYSDVAHDWEDSFVFIDIRDPDYNLLRLRLAAIGLRETAPEEYYSIR